MCGITGWIDWEDDLTGKDVILELMVEKLSRRGPDASGAWLSKSAAIGHRRLVVVDPKGGAQPMTRRRGGSVYTITYNGELYNTLELRRELETRGCVFLTRNSDTEVLLMAYIEWGPACVERLNGIYAFAVWSEADQSLFLARDRLGVKPLFYAQRGSSFIFGSEIKAILAHPAVSAEVDAGGLAEIFVMGPSRTPGHGVYRDVHELRPGSCLQVDRKGIHMRRYWALDSRPHNDGLDETVVRVRELFTDTVERQLVSDVPVCAFLSGGLDSSAITAIAGKSFKRDGTGVLHTYSIDYTGNERYFRPDYFQPDSDAQWAGRVSDFLGTNHHVIEIGNVEMAEALTAATLANDLPGMADVDSSLLLFCREVKKNHTVALSGESADEIFGGYPWFHNKDALGSDTFPWIRLMREKMRFFSPELVELLKPEEYIKERYNEALAEVPRLYGEGSIEARMREIFYLNITRFMQTLLDRKDRMSMAVGLEVRVPFCDHRLVEYVWNIPWEMKSCDYMAKGILRRALAGLLPTDVLARKKSPFPKTHSPEYLDSVRGRVLGLLDDPGSPLLPLINSDAVRSLAESGGVEFDRPWFGQLMRGPQFLAYLIQVDVWLRHYRVIIR